MIIKDMGLKANSVKESKETISGIKPVERFPQTVKMKDLNKNWIPPNYKTQREHNSLKSIKHTRNHTIEGVGRHS